MCTDSAGVSFIIPHRGRQDLLLRTLKSVAALETEESHLEIVVVTQDTDLDGRDLAYQVSHDIIQTVCFSADAAKLDSSIKPALGIGTNISLKVLNSPATATISSLRNQGAAASHGHYLAFLDADIELSPNWLVVMRMELAAQPTRVIVSAAQANPPQPKPLESVRVALSNIVVDANLQFLPGRNLFLERTTFDTIGGFPEHLTTCEDYWFTDKASRIGSLYYSSGASYVHLGEDKAYLEMARKEVWRGQSNLSTLKGRQVSFRESASFIVPLWVLFAIAALIPASLLLGSLAFVFLLLAVLLPVTLYSWRLLKSSSQRLMVNAVLRFYLLYFPARGLGMLAGFAGMVRYGKKGNTISYTRNQTK